jgi:hypothetical protein
MRPLTEIGVVSHLNRQMQLYLVGFVQSGIQQILPSLQRFLPARREERLKVGADSSSARQWLGSKFVQCRLGDARQFMHDEEVNALTCLKHDASKSRTLAKTPFFANSRRSTIVLPIRVAHRFSVVPFDENTPKGMLWMEKSLSESMEMNEGMM